MDGFLSTANSTVAILKTMESKAMMIEIDDEVADQIVVASLTSTVDYWEQQLQRYKDPEHGWIALFSVDPEEDKKEIRKMIKAAKRVLSFYGAEV